MKNFEKLASHPLMRQNFEFIKPVIEKVHPKMMKRIQETGEIRNRGTEHLESAEYYHVTVFQKASWIISAVERLENSLVYIQKFPSPRTYEKRGIHQFSWLEYHYSYFVVTYDGLFDMALILTNTVFQLGIPDKDCKPGIIMDNSWVKKTPVRSNLVTLEKITSNYGKIRNLFVHRGEMPDVKAITDSDILDLLKLYSVVYQEVRPITPVDVMDNVFKNESRKIISKLANDVVKAQEALAKVFGSLLPIYKKSTW